jgi:branched-subunit amino acid ABC-type transport system permease component
MIRLVASGLTLIFGIMDVVNFAHGDLDAGGSSGPPRSRPELLAGAPGGGRHDGVFGALLQATTLRPLLGRDPLTTILATFGASLVLQSMPSGPTARQIRRR